MNEPLDHTAALQDALRQETSRVLELTRELERQRLLLAAECERQTLDARLSQLKKLESLGVLAGGIAHDFNNLLTSVLGNTDLALAHLPPSSPARAHLKHIEYAAQRAAELTRQMLAYSGRGQFIIRPVCFGEILRGKLPAIRTALPDRVSLECDLADNLPRVDGDGDQLGQLLMHIAGNAIEAVTGSGGTIRVRTDACYCTRADLAGTYLDDQLPEGCYVCVEVADTGCGMSADTQARMFEPFFSTKFTGRGLGLAAALGILRGHRGAVSVTSELGKGTTMRMFFPARDQGQHVAAAGNKAAEGKAPAREQATGESASAPGHETPSPSSPPSPSAASAASRVLVIDDEETVRSVAKTILERVGFAVVTAATGAEGIARFREAGGQFCLVLLDMRLPKVGGQHVHDQLLRVRPDARIVLSSGYLQDEAAESFDQRGIAGYLQKPYRYDELIDCVRSVVGPEAKRQQSGSR
jgi:two-component system cell cycle sensor histidine kinase/response regulator CckA